MDRELLADISKNVLAIGRKIISPKNGKDDYLLLVRSLRYTAEAIEIMVRTHYK